MTKQELIGQFAELDIFESKAEAKRTFDGLFDIIKRELIAGNEVAIGQDFGVFKISEQAAKTGTVPGKPGQTYNSPAKNVVKFKPSSPLKSAIAGV